MAKENSQKIKMLKLIERLRQETDEEHPMTATIVCQRLNDMEVACDRRTLTRDIQALNDFGYEVMTTMISHEKAYYVEDRSFSVPELKILIDAVHAASFVTEKKTAELIEKIANLGGSHSAEILQSNMVCFNTRKHSNEAIYYNVDYLEDAIEQKKKVIFRYFDLDENGQKAYRRGGHHYVVEPITLVFNGDNYYMVCYSSKHDSTATIALTVWIPLRSLTKTSVKRPSNCAAALAFTEQAFKMYGGQPMDITIQFSDKLIGVVYDKFGEDTKMVRINENNCVASIKVQISPTFWGWLFQVGRQMTVLSPEWVIQDINNGCVN